MNIWWSVILTPLGLLGMYLSGRKLKAGWLLGLFTQVIWVLYAVATKQYPFILASLGYGSIYAKNYLAWSRNPPAA